MRRAAVGNGERGQRAPAILEVAAPDPFALVFVPAASGAKGASPTIRAIDGVLEEVHGPPRDADVVLRDANGPSRDGRAVTWSDPGRPAAALAGVEETLRRLRAQGYL